MINRFIETIANKRRALLILQTLFFLRVLGQFLVWYSPLAYLPPFQDWQSGLLSYPLLLLSQIVILVFMLAQLGEAKLLHDAADLRRKGHYLLCFGAAYECLMILRAFLFCFYNLHGKHFLSGWIPPVFHLILACYVLILGSYFCQVAQEKDDHAQSSLLKIPVSTLQPCLLLCLFFISGCSPVRWYVEHETNAEPAKFENLYRSQVEIKSKPNISLRGMLFRPQEKSQVPTIVIRLPLPRLYSAKLMASTVGELWARRGFAVLIQGVRGRFHSGGKFEPFLHERADGEATLAWLRSQPFYNGKVFLWGGSYFGLTQWSIADKLQPNEGALDIQIACSNPREMLYAGGVLNLTNALYWLGRDRDMLLTKDELLRAANRWPLETADEFVGGDSEYFNKWVNEPEYAPYWRSVDFSKFRDRTLAPVLLMAGWYDPFLLGELRDYQSLQANSHREANTRLIIGPWAHAETVRMADGIFPHDYRMESIKPTLAWYRSVLGKNISSEPPVLLYVMGENKWRAEKEWPLARARNTKLYLSSNHGLSVQVSNNIDLSSYVSDPKNPVPTKGGALLGPEAGIAEQSEIEKRADVLTFSSEPLNQDVEVTGPVRVSVFVKSTAVSIDVFVRLVDVWDDSHVYNVTDGITRLSLKTGAAPQPAEIELLPTSMVFKKGHRIRLEIMSSNFPRFAKNTNAEDQTQNPLVAEPAEETIFYSEKYPSHIILPIVPIAERGHDYPMIP